MTPSEQAHLAVIVIVSISGVVAIRRQWNKQQARYSVRKSNDRLRIDALATKQLEAEEREARNSPYHFEKLLAACPVQAPKEDLWVLHWRVKATGFEGHGQPLPRRVVEGAILDLNKSYPSIEHWAEPVEGNFACTEQAPREADGVAVEDVFLVHPERDEELSSAPEPWTGVSTADQAKHMAHLGKNYNEADAKDWRVG